LLSLACVQVSDAVLEHDQNRRQAPSAAFTLAGVNGTERSRTPVASKIALPPASSRA